MSFSFFKKNGSGAKTAHIVAELSDIPGGNVLKTLITDNTFDFASTVERTVPLDNSADYSVGAKFTLNANDTVTVNQGGFIEIYGYINMAEFSGTTSRNNIRFFLRANGTQISPLYQDNYMRNATGHEETGQSIIWGGVVNAGDIIDLRCDQIAGSGGVQRIDGRNNSDAGINSALSFLVFKG